MNTVSSSHEQASQQQKNYVWFWAWTPKDAYKLVLNDQTNFLRSHIHVSFIFACCGFEKNAVDETRFHKLKLTDGSQTCLVGITGFKAQTRGTRHSFDKFLTI